LQPKVELGDKKNKKKGKFIFMSSPDLQGKEVFFSEDEVIVSKTNIKGHIVYANPIFCKIAGYTERELLGKPHSLLRHAAMPRCVFKLLWDRIASGKEIFAYVVNRCKNNNYYWVFAHVTPSFGTDGQIVGYHSNRRVPNPETIQNKVFPLYQELAKIEKSYANRKEGMNAAYAHLLKMLEDMGVSYDEFVFSLDPSLYQEEAK
jgi:PAS domain S-box-containing protein